MEILGFIGPQELIIILLIIFLLIPIFLIIPIIALVDILKSDFEDNNKLIWVLLILFLWILGAILYFFIGRSQKINKDVKPE